ncbi:hypothetical protein [Bradyrhizobium tropiciagri]|uniref:hypothetical protein n=1 Tax=Bradyrhizobium tropiciagri TaxID=312253 RepID=UPI00067D3CD5|nr:hypothetical protein [Bradyrhizobium tropiciagri]
MWALKTCKDAADAGAFADPIIRMPNAVARKMDVRNMTFLLHEMVEHSAGTAYLAGRGGPISLITIGSYDGPTDVLM